MRSPSFRFLQNQAMSMRSEVIMQAALKRESNNGANIGTPALQNIPMKQLHLATQQYRREQYLNLSPVEVIKKLYDVAILACKKHDKTLANKAVTELIVGLNFDYQDISVGLYRLYQYVKHCLRQENYDEAENVLNELRGTWMEAFHLDDK
jgi:flagellin-specific chaperone FliS